MEKLSTADAAGTYCSECGAMPGDPCVYLLTENLARQGSHSKAVLALRARVGTPTVRPHNRRYDPDIWRLRRWLQANARMLIGVDDGTE